MQSFRFLSEARRTCLQFNREGYHGLPPCRVYWDDACEGYVLIRTNCELPRVGLTLIPFRRRGLVARLASLFR